jgi:polyferredoxin
MSSALLADLVLVVHVAVVFFILGGLVAIALGGVLRWRWVRGVAWRALHAAAMGYVAVGAVVGWVCPLTVWEDALRRRAGEAEYGTGFVQYWLERLLYHDWPGWVFTVLYLTVFALVLLAWRRVPPQRRR